MKCFKSSGNHEELDWLWRWFEFDTELILSHLLTNFLDIPLGGRPNKNFGRPWNLIHNMPCRSPCRLFIHEVFFGPLGLHLRVWSNLDGLRPFNQWELLDWNGHGPSVLCVKGPYGHFTHGIESSWPFQALIGGKGGAGPSSLHTTLEGPMEYVNARWM